jgi:hypothetical protein
VTQPTPSAPIAKVDAVAEKYKLSGCRGTLTSICSVLTTEIIGNDVYSLLNSEDAHDSRGG